MVMKVSAFAGAPPLPWLFAGSVTNNISIICKRFYIETSIKELGLGSVYNKKSTYKLVSDDIDTIVAKHKTYYNFMDDDIPEALPFLYWIPKMHKKPFSKQRYISASHYCTTKPLSKMITKA